MKKYPIFSLFSFLLFLLGCSSSPYKQKKGIWYYDDNPMYGGDMEGFRPLNNRFGKSLTTGYYRYTSILDSDAKTFEALSDHYAKDRNTVYYCDTYRSGQDYFITKRTKTIRIKEADPASFVWLEDKRYARDNKFVFYEDQPFLVKDIDSFELLPYDYAKDHVAAYYSRALIKGSDGKTFSYLDEHYSKDTNNVYFCYTRYDLPNAAPSPTSFIIPGVKPAAFKLLTEGYATDDNKIYYDGKALDATPDDFTIFNSGYAKNATSVFYRGRLIKEADAASFAMLGQETEFADSKDNRQMFKEGRKVRK